MNPLLQPHSVTPSIDLYWLMFFLSVSNKEQDRRWGDGGREQQRERKKLVRRTEAGMARRTYS